jgi:hypothetical protein
MKVIGVTIILMNNLNRAILLLINMELLNQKYILRRNASENH